MKRKLDNNISRQAWSCLLYITFFVWVFPGSNFIIPLTLWLFVKDKSAAIDEHGKNILNFQISWFLIGVIIWGVFCFLFCDTRFYCALGNIPMHTAVLGLIGFVVGLFMIAAAISAYKGELLELPLSYRFFK